MAKPVAYPETWFVSMSELRIIENNSRLKDGFSFHLTLTRFSVNFFPTYLLIQPYFTDKGSVYLGPIWKKKKKKAFDFLILANIDI